MAETARVQDAEQSHIEARTVRAWPALVTEESGGWLLRATPRVRRRRSNSAIPPVEGALEGVADVEAFYHRWNADSLVQLPSDHGELDRHLADRGYRREAPTLVLRASLANAPRTANGWNVALGPRDSEWTRVSQAVDGRVDDAGDQVIDRIPGETVFARAVHRGAVVGVGAGVVDSGWLGVFGMGTEPAHRRSGVASAVLSALLGWGRRSGAADVWLQVEEHNTGARQLYESYGFTLSHSYHYRRLHRVR
jgi:GNAT superfamily N-acetyltransferase